MKKSTKRIVENLFEALAHYKAAYKDKTAQLLDTHAKIKIVESRLRELEQENGSLLETNSTWQIRFDEMTDYATGLRRSLERFSFVTNGIYDIRVKFAPDGSIESVERLGSVLVEFDASAYEVPVRFCEDCHREIGEGAGRCKGSCTLPF